MKAAVLCVALLAGCSDPPAPVVPGYMTAQWIGVTGKPVTVVTARLPGQSIDEWVEMHAAAIEKAKAADPPRH